MAVDKQQLEQCILEAADGDKEMADFLRDRYTKNEAAAAKFMGGFMRNADYTRKTQELSGEREKLTTSNKELEKQLTATRQQLEDADKAKQKYLKDLADGKITVAKAQAIGKHLVEHFNLNDDDVPGLSDLIQTAKSGTVVDRTEDSIDARLQQLEERITTALEKKFVSTLGAELGAMSELDIIWPQLEYEHEQLFGKRMTQEERRDVLKAARAGEGSIISVWEKKFNVGGDSGVRMQKRDEKLKADWLKEREATEAADRSKAALTQVTGGNQQRDLGDGPGISPAFRTQFRQYEMDPSKPATPADGVPSLSVLPGQHVRQTGRTGPSGGQRAAQKFLEQRTGAGTKIAAA